MTDLQTDSLTPLEDMGISSGKAVSLQSTSLLGLMRKAGKTITEARPLIDHRTNLAEVEAQALYLKSLMLENKPKRNLLPVFRKEEINGKETIYRRFKYETPAASPETLDIIQQGLKPLPAVQIIDHLTRYVEIHKRHTVENDKKAMLYADYASVLFGYPEYAVTLGIIDIVKDKKIKFFPVVGEIAEAIENHLVQWPTVFEGEVSI